MPEREGPLPSAFVLFSCRYAWSRGLFGMLAPLIYIPFMSSSRDVPELPLAPELDQPIANHAGIEGPPSIGDRDPFEVLDEMMVVIEQLCPVWPERETFRADGIWLI